jgi:type I restriction enzyme S subunit
MRVPVKEVDRKNRQGPYPYYGANGQVDWIDGFLFDEPLVLLAEDGGFFGSREHPIAYKIEGKSWVNNHAHVLRPKAEIDIDYLHWTLSYYNVTQFLSGSTRAKLTKTEASHIPIPIPPNLGLQKKIAELITRVDQIRTKRRQLNEEASKIVQSVFLKMFGDPFDNPQGWPVRKLADVCCKITDGTHITPKYVSAGVPFLSVKDIRNGRLNFSDTRFISEEQHRELTKRSKPESGDILYTKVGTVGIAALVEEEGEFSIFVSIALIKPDHKIVDSKFLTAMLNSNFVKSQAYNRVKGIGVPDLHLNEIRDFDIIVPPMEMQKSFATVLGQIDKLYAHQEEAREETSRLFDTVLHSAIAGT